MREKSEDQSEDDGCHAAGRVCSEPSCNAILSIYNPSDRCSLHSRVFLPVGRVKAKKGKRR